jgi:hypothetical protein
MSKHNQYRRLASSNRRIAQTRERIELQKARLLEMQGRPECATAVQLLRTLDRALRLMTHSRAKLIKRLRNLPHDPEAPSLRRT